MRHTGLGGSDATPQASRRSLTVVTVTAAPIAAVLATVPDAQDPGRATMMVALISGALLLLGATLFYLHWRGRPVVEVGWTVAASLVVGSQVLSGAVFALASGGPSPQAPWFTVVDAAGALVALGLLACRRVERVCDPMLLGLGLGILLSGLRSLPRVVPELAEVPLGLADVALIVLAATYLGLTRSLLAERCLPAWAGARLAAAVGLVGLGEVGHSVRWSEVPAATVAGVALAVAAVLWTGTTYVMARDAMEAHGRRTAELEEALHHLESDARRVHEQLHEVKSTVAGIAGATRLLERSVAPETRQRLERTVRAELARLERLLDGDADGDATGEPGPVDLDETLDVLLESHRARGRTIEWQPCGARVQGDRDDVTEVLNILLDNAAKHGGGVASHVDVSRDADEIRIAVRDEGPGVPRELREHIFDWGTRAGTAPGQGIGLHVARRLVHRHGGSLTLAEQDARGSAFVVRLPAARTSEEHHGRHA